MTLRERRILLYSLILAFLIVGSGVVSYAYGWRVDWSAFRIAKVGGIYVRSFPSDANISLDGEPVQNKTGLLQPGTWINDLYPKNYDLKLTKPHFRPLEMSLRVEPSLVTEIKYAVMVPDKPQMVLAGPVRNFWFLKDQPLVQDPDGTLRYENQKLSGGSLLGWTLDGRFALSRSGNSYYMNDLRNGTSSSLSSALRKSGLRTNPGFIQLDPTSNSLTLVGTSNGLYLFDFTKKSLTSLATSSPVSPAISRFWISWSDYDPKTGTSRITLYDKILGTERRIPQPLPGRTLKFAWAENSTLGIVQDDGQAYTYSLGSNSLNQIARDARDLAFSPFSDRVAVLENSSLEIFSLIDSDYWRFNLADPASIRSLEWYKDGFHLLLHSGNKTRLLSLEDKNLENYLVLAESGRIQYDQEANLLYYLQDGAIYRLNFPS